MLTWASVSGIELDALNWLQGGTSLDCNSARLGKNNDVKKLQTQDRHRPREDESHHCYHRQTVARERTAGKGCDGEGDGDIDDNDDDDDDDDEEEEEEEEEK
ncbi:hypothetical protein ElyMa_005273800 [Elysia marginata]|uniref:Uncharacterized protein n=1 Tax=Elysia marginata TaxID=1093978 RepID=A0AAV4JXF6_9GAST|nr:hypothetical protein ElyMa_005273800 [Elysia marginata]